jgi:hypothetical protein
VRSDKGRGHKPGVASGSASSRCWLDERSTHSGLLVWIGAVAPSGRLVAHQVYFILEQYKNVTNIRGLEGCGIFGMLYVRSAIINREHYRMRSLKNLHLYDDAGGQLLSRIVLPPMAPLTLLVQVAMPAAADALEMSANMVDCVVHDLEPLLVDCPETRMCAAEVHVVRAGGVSGAMVMSLVTVTEPDPVHAQNTFMISTTQTVSGNGQAEGVQAVNDRQDGLLGRGVRRMQCLEVRLELQPAGGNRTAAAAGGEASEPRADKLLDSGSVVKGKQQYRLQTTKHAAYVAHSCDVVCLAAHALLPFVASSSLGGTGLVWQCRDMPTNACALTCVGVTNGRHRELAWSAWCEAGSTVWDSGLLWALGEDGRKVEAYSVWKSDALAPKLLDPCYQMQVPAEGQGGCTGLYAMLDSVSDWNQENKITQHVLVVITVGRLHALRVSVGPDAHGHPKVLDHVVVGSLEMQGEPAACLSPVAELDWSWRGAGNGGPTLLGFHLGAVVRYVIKRESISVSKEPLHTADAVFQGRMGSILQVSSISAREIVLLAVEPEGASEGEAVQNTVAYVLECKSTASWRVHSLLPPYLSKYAKISSYLTGDGGAVLALLDVDRIMIFAPRLQSRPAGIFAEEWTGPGGKPEKYKRECEGKVADNNLHDIVSNGWVRFSRRWTLIKSEFVGKDLSLTQQPSTTAVPTVATRAWTRCLAWCRDGSLVFFGLQRRMAMLAAGADSSPGLKGVSGIRFRGNSENAEQGNGAAEVKSEEATRPTQALWSIVDTMRVGPSSVYYHPTILEHALLLGRLSDVEQRLNALLTELRGQDLEKWQCGPAYCSPFFSSDSAIDSTEASGGDEFIMSSPAACKAPTVVRSKFAALKGVDLSPLKRLAGMKLADASKVGPASALISRQPVLLHLLPEAGLHIWDKQQAKLSAAPDWKALLQSIEDAEIEAENFSVHGREEAVTPVVLMQSTNVECDGHDGTHGSADRERVPILGKDNAAQLVACLRATLAEFPGSSSSNMDWPVPNEIPGAVVIPGLHRFELMRLIALIEGVREAREESLLGLDQSGLTFLVACRTWHHLSEMLRAQSLETALPTLNGHTVCFALHSDAQDVLVERGLMDDGAALESLSVPLWLESTPRLRAYTERIGRAVYLVRQDPMDALLYYVLARKVSLLQGLFKKAGQEKVSLFLQRDFASDEAARTAACSNAYSLIAKGRHEAAAAFFVLGGAVDHALDLAAINLARPMLALLIARLAPAPAATDPAAAADAEAAAVRRTLEKAVMTGAVARGDRGTMHAVKWRLEQHAEAYSILWSSAAAAAEVRRETSGMSGGKLRGLLSRFDTDDEVVELSNKRSGSGFDVEDCIHACTPALLAMVAKRPRMRLALGMQQTQLVPVADVMLHSVSELLSCGCAALAVTACLLYSRDDAEAAGADTSWFTVLASRVCLAWLTDWIRWVSAQAWRRSVGEICPQRCLQALQRELKRIMLLYGLSEKMVLPQLVRFCQVRGLWRIQHALVTAHYGQAGRDATLAEVAVHPLTISMMESVVNFSRVLGEEGGRVWLLARMERTGKLLQLILHSLTIDKAGNTGTLAALAASVMAVHFMLVWARSDASALRSLLLCNEGAEDQDSAMALAWLMDACDPAQFPIGSSSSAEPGLSADCAKGSIDRGISGGGSRGDKSVASAGAGCDAEASSDFDDARGESDGSNLQQGRRKVTEQQCVHDVEATCLKWLLVTRFHSRLAMALSGPREESWSNPIPIVGGQACSSCTVQALPHPPSVLNSSSERVTSTVNRCGESCVASSVTRGAVQRPHSGGALPASSEIRRLWPAPSGGSSPLAAAAGRAAVDTQGEAAVEGLASPSPAVRMFSQVKSWARKRSSSLDRIQDHLKTAALRASARMHASPMHASPSAPSLHAASGATVSGANRFMAAESFDEGLLCDSELNEIGGGCELHAAHSWHHDSNCANEIPWIEAGHSSTLLHNYAGGSGENREGVVPRRALGFVGSDGRRRTAGDTSQQPGCWFCDPLVSPDSTFSSSYVLGNSMSRAFFACDDATQLEPWQREAAERIGNQLLRALAEWSLKLSQRLCHALIALICHRGSVGGLALVHERETEAEEGLRSVGLWEHYRGQEHLHRLISQALTAQILTGAECETAPLLHAWDEYHQRNCVLDTLQYPGQYTGRLSVTVIAADAIQPPPSSILMLGHAVKTASIFNLQPVAPWPAGAGPISGRPQMALDNTMQAGQWMGMGSGDFRPTTQVWVTYQSDVQRVGGEPELVRVRQKSPWVRKNASPRFNFAAAFDVPRQMCLRHVIKVDLVEKHNFGEDVIGTGQCDVSMLQQGAEHEKILTVCLTRPDSAGAGVADDGHVCLVQLRVHLVYSLDTEEERWEFHAGRGATKIFFY